MYPTIKKQFKFLPHTADIKFQAFGKTIEEVFKNSALAISNSMFNGKIKKKIIKKIKIHGKNRESLLYTFLDEIVYLFDAEGFLLSNIRKLKIKNNKVTLELNAELIGDKTRNYEIKEHIKSVTYHDMFIKQDKRKNKWTAQIVLDV